MSYINPDSEAALELETLALLRQMGWETINAYHEAFSPATATVSKPYVGRANQGQVILRSPLQAALEKLNPDLPAEALNLAMEELSRYRGAMDPARANQEIYGLLKEGIKVPYRDESNDPQIATVRVIDWQEPTNNHFLLVAQLWISGDYGSRRPDLIGFVNGLPLLFIELKTSHVRLENAYRHNYRDYRDTIPALFWYNGLIILSNGSAGRVGSLTAPWEHYGEWKRITQEGETGLISLETTLRATCPPQRLLDLIENFTLFSEAESGLSKLVAKNHQYLRFKQGHRRTELEKLRGAISHKLKSMIRLNRQRLDYQQRFQQMIEAYNSGASRVEETYQALLAFLQTLTAEDQRHLAEGLSEEELAIFDLLTKKPEIKLKKKEQQQVKQAARELLARLKQNKLTLDWRKRQQAQADVRLTINDILDAGLPEVYTPELYVEKCELVYQHIYEHYYGEGRSTYSTLPLGV